MSTIGNLIDSSSTNSVSLLNSLVTGTELAETLDTDLGATLSSVTDALSSAQQELTRIVNEVASGEASAEAIAASLQSLNEQLAALDTLLAGTDTPAVNALREALNTLSSDLNSLAGNASQEQLLAALNPIADGLESLNDSLTPDVIDQPVGDVLGTVLANDALLDAIVTDLDQQAEPVRQAVEPLTSQFATVLDSLSNGTMTPEEAVDELNGIIDGLQTVADTLGSTGSASVNELVNGLQDMASDLAAVVADIQDGSVPTATSVVSALTPAKDNLTKLKETLTGSGSDPNKNIFNGTDGNDVAETTSKQDIFDMKAGNDKVTSTFDNLKQVDSLAGGEGVDTLVLMGGTSKDVLKLQVATASTTNNIVTSGLPENTVVTGFEVFDLRGFKGRGLIKGGTGADVGHGGRGKDKFSGQKGNDLITGGHATDRLAGGNGKDSLLGELGSDILLGGDGNDVLTGSLGKDKLKTGKGRDKVIFDSLKDTGDRIKDFQSGKDSLLIKGSAFSKELKVGELKKSQFVLGDEAKSRGASFIYNQEKNSVLFDADGTGRGKAVLVAQLTDKASLSVNDIVIF